MDKRRASERTSQEVRQRWDKENLKKYGISFHLTHDKELVEYIETQKANGKGTSEIFREAIEKLKNEG